VYVRYKKNNSVLEDGEWRCGGKFYCSQLTTQSPFFPSDLDSWKNSCLTDQNWSSIPRERVCKKIYEGKRN
jgi:hypothetical protein